MLKKILTYLAIIICLFAIVITAIYQMHKSYFRGSVDSYMSAQQLHKSAIKSNHISYNWTDDGQWEDDVMVSENHTTYEYVYNMEWKTPISLEIYHDRDSVSNTSHLKYPPLKYDQDAVRAFNKN
ncbi:hypothetical protein WR164_02590 [Philodulcilactobacillus myokoensis]|uniref:DUF3139 domain-containing protein n=1 Tax=Philodulcilactobacillus myokoensis TaxID=2929573 RepID=A0A9W6ERV0_9LACO|nr:DUF3139 domain-containing protein [Philodulcilactobacillus myokoensis]GLB46280.1 hypothetical protein WR164_02590 [Philodulcilactobacillus myokoensis]